MKLNQIIAVEKGVKARVTAAVTELHKICQKSMLFDGFTKVYEKRDAEGEDLPKESKRVQNEAGAVTAAAFKQWAELVNTTALKDFTNCTASADVVVEGVTLIKAAPVSFLLFLEKRLVDAHTFVSKLPTLDEAESWTFDAQAGHWVSDVIRTHRTNKQQLPIVKYPATDKHPAQTEMITKDVIVGFWNQTKQSGAIPRTEKDAILQRVDAVLSAVKYAREQANMADVVPVPDVGKALFGFIYKPAGA